jgi:hypothetical protein
MAFFNRAMSRSDLALVANNARVNHWQPVKLTEGSDIATLNAWLARSHGEAWDPSECTDLDHAWAEVFSTLEAEGRNAARRA